MSTQETAALIQSVNQMTATVAGKMGQIDTKVAQKITELNTWKSGLKADQMEGVARYAKTIDLTGLSPDYFFPVFWSFPGNNHGGGEMVISRSYPENGGADDPFNEGTPNHVAGLLLQLDGGSTPWSGDSKYLHIKRLSQTYRETVRNLKHAMLSIARPIDGSRPLFGGLQSGAIASCMSKSGCYLRGGLTYHVLTNWASNLEYSRELGEVEIGRSVQPTFEIKWVVKAYPISDAFLGTQYPDKLVSHQYHNDNLYAAKA
jgi:hypothetical protein